MVTTARRVAEGGTLWRLRGGGGRWWRGRRNSQSLLRCVWTCVCVIEQATTQKKREKYIHRLRQFEIFFFFRETVAKTKHRKHGFIKTATERGRDFTGKNVRVCEWVNDAGWLETRRSRRRRSQKQVINNRKKVSNEWSLEAVQVFFWLFQLM